MVRGRLAAVAILAAYACLSTHAEAAAPIYGRWRTPRFHGIVDIHPCGERVCGVLISTDQIAANPTLLDSMNRDRALRGRTLKGMTIIQGSISPAGRWADGQFYNPKDGNTYTGNLSLTEQDQLKVTVCLNAFLCRSDIWSRGE